MTTSDTLRERLLAQTTAFNNASGLLKNPPNVLGDFFGYNEPDSPSPAALMDGDVLLGWMWPCGSVYMETEHHPDPDVRRMPAAYDDMRIVASLAGAPHVLTEEQAFALYRKTGWVAGTGLPPLSEALDPNTALVYRPTLVIHPIDAPERPIAVGTGELRLEAAGTDGLITSASILGFAILDGDHAKAAGYFLAQVLAVHLGNISAYSCDYAPEHLRHLVMVNDSTERHGVGSVPAEVLKITQDEFGSHFAFRRLGQEEIDLENDDAELDDEPSESEPRLRGLSLHHLDTPTDMVALEVKAGPALAAAVAASAAVHRVPGLADAVARGQAQHHAILKRGVPALLESVRGTDIKIGPAIEDSEFRWMRTHDVTITLPNRKPITSGVTVYEAWRDPHPFDTWDNSDYGVLDTLELIHPGSTFGDGFSTLKRASLGYADLPAQCLVLHPPIGRLAATRAPAYFAALIWAAYAVAIAPDAMLIQELPVWDGIPDADDDAPRTADYPGLYAAMQKVGFRTSSRWVYACPRAVWETACAVFDRVKPRGDLGERFRLAHPRFGHHT